MKKFLAMILALVMALGVTTMAWAAGTKTVDDYTAPTNSDLTPGSDGVYSVADESDLRTALYFAPTDGNVRTIKLTASITLEMLYSGTIFSHSNEAATWKSEYTEEAATEIAAKEENGEIDDNAVGKDTLSHYKYGVHPDESNPKQWSSEVTSQTLEQKAAFKAKIHSAAGDEQVARLVVKAGQNVVLDLNGFTIGRKAGATHGAWGGNVSTDLIANYGELRVTDNSEVAGTLKGSGFYSCGGAVLHNYDGTMTVEKVNVYGNAEAMTNPTTGKHSSQYVIVNDGGSTVIDGANVYDTHSDIDASLVVTTKGTMTIKGNATLNHPNTKTINAKGGTTIVESATIISDVDAIYAKAGTVTVKNVTMQGDGKVVIEETASADLTLPVGTVIENSGTGTVTVNGNTVKSGESYTVPQPPRYYYNSTTTTDTKKDETKGSPKTFDAGVGIYAVSALLSVTGMAYVGKKKF